MQTFRMSWMGGLRSLLKTLDGSVQEAVTMRFDDVAILLREVAEVAILPRFQRLAAGDVRDKSPGEEVTIADEDAERLLTSRLMQLMPGSVVIGEEAAARSPELLEQAGQESVWLVDPLDGTSNFVAGSACFSTMGCLLRRGEAIGAWMLSPVSGTLHMAEKGSGAFVEGSEATRLRLRRYLIRAVQY